MSISQRMLEIISELNLPQEVKENVIQELNRKKPTLSGMEEAFEQMRKRAQEFTVASLFPPKEVHVLLLLDHTGEFNGAYHTAYTNLEKANSVMSELNEKLDPKYGNECYQLLSFKLE